MRRAVLLCLAVACGSDGTSDPAGVIQLSGLTVAPASASCLSNFEPSEYTLVFRVHVINTTPAPIAVTGVSSNGIVIRATAEEDVANAAHVFASLPYTPEGATVRARDGDVTLTATMSAVCGLATIRNEESFKDVQMNLRVRTSTGEYLSPPLTIRITARPAR